MDTLATLEQAILLAQRFGYQVRQEWLDGAGGGHCQIGGQRTLFLDLSQDAIEQLDRVLVALQSYPGLDAIAKLLSPEMANLVSGRRAA